MKLIRLFASGLKNGFVAIGALAFLGGALAIADYAVTQGAGTNFGSKIIGGIHFAEQLICDFTTGGQCASVTASNALKVDNSAVNQPVTQITSPWIVSNPNAQQVLQGTTPWIVSSQTGFGGGSGGSVTQGTSPWIISGTVAIPNGSDVTLGNTTDTACAGDNTSGCTVEQRLQRIAQNLSTLNTTAGNPIVAPLNISPNDCSGSITVSATAQNAFTAQTTLHGFTIFNIDASAGSGEPLWISFTGTASPNTAGSFPLQAPAATTFATGGSFTAPIGFGTSHALSVVGATATHKFSCTWW